MLKYDETSKSRRTRGFRDTASEYYWELSMLYRYHGSLEENGFFSFNLHAPGRTQGRFDEKTKKLSSTRSIRQSSPSEVQLHETRGEAPSVVLLMLPLLPLLLQLLVVWRGKTRRSQLLRHHQDVEQRAEQE